MNNNSIEPPKNEGDNLRNLRSRGYPSSMEGNVRKFKTFPSNPKPQNLIMNDAVHPEFLQRYSQNINIGPERWLVNNAVDIYNALKSGNESWPSINAIAKDEYDNQNRLVREVNGIQFAFPNNGVNGFLQKDAGVKTTRYSGLVNGLDNFFGDNNFQGVYNTPFGKVTGTYDGDSIYGTLTNPVNENYYYRALKTLLDRGVL